MSEENLNALETFECCVEQVLAELMFSKLSDIKIGGLPRHERNNHNKRYLKFNTHTHDHGVSDNC